MDANFARWISSPMFTFLIGPEKTPITVHSLPLAELSPALASLMNGPMIEASSRQTDWLDVDFHTFIRLCEFAYKGDYTPPSPTPREDTLAGVNSQDSSLHSAKKWKFPKKGKSKGKNKAREDVSTIIRGSGEQSFPGNDKRPLSKRILSTLRLKRFLANPFLFFSSNKKSGSNNFPVQTHTAALSQDFTPVFVEQTKLYALADKYLIDYLRNLVYQRLQQTLREFILHPSSVSAMVEFIRFVYSNNSPAYDSHPDPLRVMVTRYVVSAINFNDSIANTQEFRELLAEHEEEGEISGTLCYLVTNTHG